MTINTINLDQTETVAPLEHIDADIILLDDNQVFADAFIFRFVRKKVAHFNDPRDFIGQHQRYAKDVIVCIDYDFGRTAPVTGLDVAIQLHELGFTRLFLVSGTYFSDEVLPPYLTFIEKINLEFFSVM